MSENELPEVEFEHDTKAEIPKEKNKGVLVIYTGGTIGSVPKDPNDPGSPMIVAKWREFRKAVPKVSLIPFTIDACSFVEPLDSSNVGPQHWKRMAKIIGNNYDNYEGFVVLHGTDTMVYTASALSFMLQNLEKPVIITGSQIPAIEQVRNDAEQNLITAILIANPKHSNIPTVKEVCIFFRDNLLRGNRTRKRDASGYTAFETPNYHVLGTAGDNIDIEEKFLREPQGEFRAIYTLDTNVIVIDLFPGFQDRGRIRDLMFHPNLFKAIVLKTYGTGNVPTEAPKLLFSLLKKYRIKLRSIFEDNDETGEKSYELPADIRGEFKEKNIPLPDTSRLYRIDDKCLELSDRSNILQDHRYKLEDTYLFSLKPEYNQHLKEGPIIDILRAEFKKNRLSLSSKAKITKENNRDWKIIDGDNKYDIEDYSKHFRIYDTSLLQLNVYPLGFLDDIKMTVIRGQIIVNVTQCPYGQVEQGLYDTSAVLTDCGVISGQEITPEAALCKLMVILGRKEEEKIKETEWVIENVNKNLVGEQNLSIYTTPLRIIDGEVISKEPFWYYVPATKLSGISHENDSRKIERAILRFKNALVRKEPEYLFSLKFGDKVEVAGKIHSSIAKAFDDNGHPLSKDYVVLEINKNKWKITDGVRIYSIKREKEDLIVHEDEKPLKIKIFINLSPSADSADMKRYYVDTYKKQQNSVKQSLAFDITKKALKLTPESSIAFIIEDKTGSIEFDEIELSLFINDDKPITI